MILVNVSLPILAKPILTTEPFKPSNQPLLSASNIGCIKEDRILFEQLNFQINAGDLVQVAGPNGVGKTSLLRILAGLSRPTDGHVRFNNQLIDSNSDYYHQHLLYIGHLAGIKGELSAQENLAFKLALAGQSPALAEQALAAVNLLGFEDITAHHLSAGQHRRIALAQLWQTTAQVWILDEPFTAIDKQGFSQLEQQFKLHLDRGGCIIFTSHQDLSLLKDRLTTITLHYSWY